MRRLPRYYLVINNLENYLPQAARANFIAEAVNVCLLPPKTKRLILTNHPHMHFAQQCMDPTSIDFHEHNSISLHHLWPL